MTAPSRPGAGPGGGAHARRFREAAASDADAILALMRAYYADDGYPFVDREARAAVLELVDDASLGGLWVACDQGRVIAYLAVTMGFSLESRGREALLDELFVAPGYRGRGLGREALALAEDYCRGRSVRVLHLEVEPGRESARQLYRAAGFIEGGRRVMLRRLD